MLVLVRHCPTSLGVALRYPLVRRLAKSCGDCVAVFEGAYLYNLENVEFGDNISIHPMCYVDGTGGLSVGSNVSIAHATTIMTTEHDYTQLEVPIREAPGTLHPVAIGDDVWIGSGARILAGVSVGDRVVVGAGAVVTKDIPSHTISVGVPARPLRTADVER